MDRSVDLNCSKKKIQYACSYVWCSSDLIRVQFHLGFFQDGKATDELYQIQKDDEVVPNGDKIVLSELVCLCLSLFARIWFVSQCKSLERLQESKCMRALL